MNALLTADPGGADAGAQGSADIAVQRVADVDDAGSGNAKEMRCLAENLLLRLVAARRLRANYMVYLQLMAVDGGLQGVAIGIGHDAGGHALFPGSLQQHERVGVDRRIAPIVLQRLDKRGRVGRVIEQVQRLAKAEQFAFIEGAERIVIAVVDGAEEALAPGDRKLRGRDRKAQGLDDGGTGGLHRLVVAGGDGAVEIDHQGVEFHRAVLLIEDWGLSIRSGKAAWSQVWHNSHRRCQGEVVNYDYDGMSFQVLAERKGPYRKRGTGTGAQYYNLEFSGDRFLSTYLHGPLGPIARTEEGGNNDVADNRDHY